MIYGGAIAAKARMMAETEKQEVTQIGIMDPSLADLVEVVRV
jgi:hypothetical protein